MLKPFLLALYPLFLYIIGYLNYSKAGLFALNALLIIAVLLHLRPLIKKKYFDYLFLVVLFYLIAFMQFHAVLRDMFGVTQDDYMIIKSIINTNINESKEFLSQYKFFLLKHTAMALAAFFAYYYLFFKYKPINFFAKKPFWIFLILLVVSQLNPTTRRHNPFVYFPYYYKKYKKDMAATQEYMDKFKEKINGSKIDAKYAGEGNNTLIWVIGESVPKREWSFFGYERDTNAFLKKYKNKIYLFKNIYAAAPVTIAAFKLMLTKANRQSKNWLKHMDIITLAKKAGYKIFWISNQTSDTRGVIGIFAKNCDKFIMTNRGSAQKRGSYDEVVLKPFKEALKDKSAKKFIILHLVEAHFDYRYRYPKSFEHFGEDEVYKKLAKIRAPWALFFRTTYDNALYYSDYIRAKILDMAIKADKNGTVTLLYHPDHGEDVLFHSNFAGHNKKAIEQWEIPMFLYSKKFKADQTVLNRKYQLDEVDNLILHLLNIKTKYYDAKNDILSSSFKSKIKLPKNLIR